MRRAIGDLVILAALACVVAGCGASADPALRTTLAALATPVASAHKSMGDPNVKCKNVTASLHPPATLPAPNQMPAGSFMARIHRSGYLVAGVNAGAYKFGYLNPATGKIEGFEIDLVNELAKAIFGDAKGHVRLVALTVPQRFKFLRQRKVDIVVDTVTITCYRRTLADFSTVYYNATQRVLVPTNSPAQSIRQLAHKKVCATAASTPVQVMEALPAPARPVIVQAPQAVDCLVRLQEGLIDGISTDSSILLGFQAQDPNTMIVGPSLGLVPYGMAISKAHPDFVRFVNGVLAHVRSDGSWRAIYAKWLGKPIPNPPRAQYDG